MNTAKTVHSTDVEEPKVERPESTDTYRAPRLVALGAAVNLVQGYIGGRWDGGRGYWQS
jgi:hypothetical protein